MYTQEEILTNRKKWADALRSGKYSQTKYVLKNDRGYCLGVACEIFKDHPNVRADWEIKDDGSYEFLHSDTTLPESICQLLGINVAGSFDRELEEGHSSLVDQNDEMDATFEEIADIIEDPDTVWLNT